MSTTHDPYVLMAFTMSTVSHGNFGMWRHPADRTADYTDVRYWVELARLLDDPERRARLPAVKPGA